MGRSIRSRLTLSFLGLAIVPLLVTGTLLILQSYRTQRSQALALQHEIASETAVRCGEFIGDLQGQLALVIAIEDLISLSADAQRGVLTRLQFQQPAFEELALFDAQGALLSSSSRREVSAGDHTEHAGWQDVHAALLETGETYIGLVHFHEGSSEPYIQMAVPLMDPATGRGQGVLIASVRFRAIWTLISQVSVGDAGFAYLVGPVGDVIAHPSPSVVLQGTKRELPETDGVYPGLDGGRVALTMARVPLGDQAFTVVVERPLQEVLAETLRTAAVIGTIVVLAIVGAGALGWATVRAIVTPVESLATVVRAVRAGDLVQRATIDSSDEIGDLALAFNEMTAELSASMAGLEAQRQGEAAQRRTLEEAVSLYRAYMADVGAGHLSARLDLDTLGGDGDDLIVTLGRSLNATTGSLEAMVSQMRDAAQDISRAANDIVTTTRQQSVLVSQQAAAVTETVSVVQEVEETSREAVVQAQRVANRAESSVRTAEEGLGAVTVAEQGMARIRETVQSIAGGTRELQQRSQRIGEITATVQDLADQARLLAVNAAMEAARAGDAGREFAVVAREMRSLADASRAATEQVRVILREIEKASAGAAAVTEVGVNRVDEGVEQAGVAGRAIAAMSEDAHQTLVVARDIATSASLQMSGMDSVGRAMADIDQASSEGERGIRHLEAAADQLAELATRLNEVVARYDVA